MGAAGAGEGGPSAINGGGSGGGGGEDALDDAGGLAGGVEGGVGGEGEEEDGDLVKEKAPARKTMIGG